MRKHFLILMLFALLPLAGFAEGISLAEVYAIRATFNPDYQLIYTNADLDPQIIGVQYKLDADQDGWTDLSEDDFAEMNFTYYTFDGEAYSEDPVTIHDAGTYYIKFAATEGNQTFTSGTSTDEDHYQAITVAKRNLTITIFDAEKEYGDPDPVLTWQAISGLAAGDSETTIGLNVQLDRVQGDAVNTTDGYAYNIAGAEFVTKNYNIITTSEPVLRITKAPLTIKYLFDGENEDNIVLDYQEAIPTTLPKFYTGNNHANNAAFTIIGLKNGETYYDVFGDQQITMHQDENAANADANGTVLAEGGEYDITFEEELTATNYDIVGYPANKMLIKQIALDDERVTVTAAAGQELVYNGVSQVPVFTVKFVDAEKNIDYTLVPGDLDLGIEVWDPEEGEEGDFVAAGEDGAKNVGKYRITYNAADEGNFSGASETKTVYYIIKRTVYITVEDQVKTYDGEEFPVEEDEDVTGLFSFNNLASADRGTAWEGISVAYNDELEDHKAAGTYTVHAEVDPESNLLQNYNPQSLTLGTYTINKRNVKVAGKVLANVNYGTAATALVANATTVAIELNGAEDTEEGEGMIEGDDDEIYAALELAYGDGVTVGEVTPKGNYTYAITVDGEYDGNYTIAVDGDGAYNVVGVGFTMLAKSLTYTYDGTSDYTTKFAFQKSISDALGADVEYEVWKEGAEAAEENMPTDAGEYIIKIVQKAAYAPASGNYDGNNITYIDGDLTISPKELTIKPIDQTLPVGTTADELETYNINDNKIKFTGIVEADAHKIQYTIVFKEQEEAGDGGVVLDTNDALTMPEEGNTYANGLTIVLPEAAAIEPGMKNANYIITPDFGAVKVIGETALILDKDDVDLLGKIEDAAEACEEGIVEEEPTVLYDVTFGARTLKADTWYTMVLPFSVKATELVNAMVDEDENPVFTITNRLNEATKTGKLVFKLEMKEIPANEPFLIKTAEDVNLSSVSFEDKFIEYDATPESPAYDDNKLIGTYKNIKINCPLGSKMLKWLVNQETEKPATPGTYYNVNDWRIPRDYEAPIFACEAYLSENKEVTNDAHPTIITVEDFDGQTTSIKTLNTETMKAYVAEGWYTIDGIRLQSAPVEKGVYINNGKKVVIK